MSEIIDFSSKKQEFEQQSSPDTVEPSATDRLHSRIDAEIADAEVREVLHRVLRPSVICFQLPQKETYTPEEAALIAQMISLSLLNL